MAKKEKDYTQEQIDDAEKLCQIIQKVPDTKRQMLSAMSFSLGGELLS